MPAKRLPLTENEMTTIETERRENSRLYKRDNAEFADTQIADLVSAMTEELSALSKAPKPVSLTDTERVKRLTIDYIKNCANAATLPSTSGLARALGLTRSALYDCINRKSPEETAKWLEITKDGFAELLSNSALKNSVNPIPGIFILKSVYGLREGLELFTTSRQDNYGPFGAGLTAEELAAKYADLPED